MRKALVALVLALSLILPLSLLSSAGAQAPKPSVGAVTDFDTWLFDSIDPVTGPHYVSAHCAYAIRFQTPGAAQELMQCQLGPDATFPRRPLVITSGRYPMLHYFSDYLYIADNGAFVEAKNFTIVISPDGQFYLTATYTK